jgi:hypothetical protein
MTMALTRVALVGALIAAGLAAVARADTPEAEAKRHFDEGTKAYNLGEFVRAATEYRAAYNAKPDPVLLYNIAQAYRLGNDFQQALFFYKSFRRNLPDAANRAEVDERIRTLEEQIERQKSVAISPPNNTVAPGTPPPATTNEAERPAPAPAPETASVPAASSEPPPAANTSSERRPLYKKWWLWTAVGAVVVGAAVGIGVGVATSGGSAPPPSHFGTTKIFTLTIR